ncbi:uncharacterized protein LOC143202622 [Rhynchophorus ferrugineus]
MHASQETINKCQQLLEYCHHINEKCEVLKKDNIKLKASCDIFQKHFNNDPLKEEFDTPAKIFLNQCRNMSVFYKNALETRNALLLNANNLLANEKLANAKLIEDNKKLQATIESMKMMNVKY